MMKKLQSVYGIKLPRPTYGFMFNVEKGLDRLKSRKRKSVKTAYLLAIFLGPFGAHNFYLNRWFLGCVYLFTFGIFGVGWIIDLFRIGSLVEDENDNDESYRYSKCRLDAYLVWFPFGLIGWHHFYLRNYTLGFLYLFTFGVYGVGWVLDGFFMPSLVEQSNTEDTYSTDLEILKTYLIAASPFGILGAHQYYSGRKLWGLAYTLTLAGCGVWWMIDLFRISAIVHRCKQWRVGINLKKKYADDVYLIWFWFGLLGGHHFYLKRYKAGLLYLFTFGCFGFGWLIDIVRIPWIVRDYNLDRLSQDDMVFSDALTDSFSSFDKQDIQRAVRRARYSDGENVFPDNDSNDNQMFNQEFDHIRSSIRSLQRPKNNVGDYNEYDKSVSGDKNVSKITTVAIVSHPDDTMVTAAKLKKAETLKIEKQQEFRKAVRSQSLVESSNNSGVVLNPNYLSNSLNGKYEDIEKCSCCKEKREKCFEHNKVSGPDKDHPKQIKVKTRTRRVSFHLGDCPAERTDLDTSPHIQMDATEDNLSQEKIKLNDHSDCHEGNNENTVHMKKENSMGQNRRVKSDAVLLKADNRKRILSRSNTEITPEMNVKSFHSVKDNAKVDMENNRQTNDHSPLADKSGIIGRRVKSDVSLETADKRKRKLIRSNTQVATLSWHDPFENSVVSNLADEETNNGDTVSSKESTNQSSLPRIKKIRSIKTPRTRIPKLAPQMSSATTQTNPTIPLSSSSLTIPYNSEEYNINCDSLKSPGGSIESQDVSAGVIHIVTSATNENVFDDIEEIPFEKSTRNGTLSSTSFKSIKDTGIGLQNLVPDLKSNTKRSMSFPSRQISLDKDALYNDNVLVVNDNDCDVISPTKTGWIIGDESSLPSRRSSTPKCGIDGWTEKEKVQKPLRRASTNSCSAGWTSQENKRHKRKMSLIPKLSRAKSDAHTPVEILEEPSNVLDAMTPQLWT